MEVTISPIHTCVYYFPAGALRLLGSSEGPKGRLEIYHNGTWGTVCNNRFDVTEANSACRQLGFSKSTRRGTVGDFGYETNF